MNEFRTPPEEVTRMIAELVSVREEVRALAARVAAVERHLRRVYQIPKASNRLLSSGHAVVSRVDRESVLRRFDELRAAYLNRGAEGAEIEMTAMPEMYLRDLARELGLPNSRRAGLVKIRALIVQRLRESSLLGVRSVLGGHGQTAESTHGATENESKDAEGGSTSAGS